MGEKETISAGELDAELARLGAERQGWRARERELLGGAEDAAAVATELAADAGRRALDGDDPTVLARELGEQRAIVEINSAAALEARERGNSLWVDEGRVLGRVKRAEAVRLREESAAIQRKAGKHLSALAEIEGVGFEPARSSRSGVPWSPRSTMLLDEAHGCEVAAEQLENRSVPSAGDAAGSTLDELLAAIDEFVDRHGAARTPARADVRAWWARVVVPLVVELEAGLASGVVRPGEVDVDARYVGKDRVRVGFAPAGKRLLVELLWRDGRIDEGRSRARLVPDLSTVEVGDVGRAQLRAVDAARFGGPQPYDDAVPAMRAG